VALSPEPRYANLCSWPPESWLISRSVQVENAQEIEHLVDPARTGAFRFVAAEAEFNVLTNV